jgi:hypothetical protein
VFKEMTNTCFGNGKVHTGLAIIIIGGDSVSEQSLRRLVAKRETPSGVLIHTGNVRVSLCSQEEEDI